MDLNVLEDMRDSLSEMRRQRDELVGALQDTIAEVSWFVSRKKDLAALLPEGNETWADVLDRDLDIARAALEKIK